MAIKPISPREAAPELFERIPEAVIEAFNYLIVKNIRHGQSVICRSEIVHLIARNMMISPRQIFDKKYLDIEPLFREQGWIVEYKDFHYDSPNHWEPHFVFIFLKEKTR